MKSLKLDKLLNIILSLYKLYDLLDKGGIIDLIITYIH